MTRAAPDPDLRRARTLLERARAGVGFDDCAARAALEEVVALLDGPGDDATDAPRLQLVTRAIVAGGRLLLAARPSARIAATLEAAEGYLRSPDEGAHAAYFEAATRSYPFGAGEGCYGEGGCGPGSGCRTGAGSLRSIADEVGPAALLAALADELGPWLEASVGGT